MKRIINLIFLSMLLLASCNKQETRPTEIKVQVEKVSGSRASITVVPANLHAYYSYVLVSENDENFDAPVSEICKEEIRRMEKSYPSFETGSFTDVFCFRGSRRLTMRTLSNDMDFKFIVFQINPKTHELIGQPIANDFHTKTVPTRDMHFDIHFEDDILSITPTDDNFTYIWQVEETEVIDNIYRRTTIYLYMIVEMYMEYGFLDWCYVNGPIEWDFAYDNMIDNTEYTLVASGCEEGEFTTPITFVKFRYHPGNIEVLEVFEGDEFRTSHYSDDNRSGISSPNFDDMRPVDVKMPRRNMNRH